MNAGDTPGPGNCRFFWSEPQPQGRLLGQCPGWPDRLGLARVLYSASLIVGVGGARPDGRTFNYVVLAHKEQH